MSSADFEPEEPAVNSKQKSSPSKQFTDSLNTNDGPSKGTGISLKKMPEKNSFQQMLAESEMKVSVAKKAPKKGMQLGKPKTKKNALI